VTTSLRRKARIEDLEEIAACRSNAGPLRVTPQQRRVLTLVFMGASDIDIGESLGISPRTVSFHLGEMRKRFCVLSRTGLIYRALEEGLLAPPPVRVKQQGD
jgi:DNA-binding NarL/FixJ family response regulator